MKKIVLLLSSVIALSAFAIIKNVEAKPKKVINVKRCIILDGFKKLYATTAKNKAVYNKSGSVLKCSAKKIPSKKAVKWTHANTGYWCYTGKHFTKKWHATVSKTGNATLTCHAVKPKK